MGLTFKQLREANISRCARWNADGVDGWSLAEYATAAAEELGEVCGVIKRLTRLRDGMVGTSKTAEEYAGELAHEIADTVTYLDILAARAGVDLGKAVAEKFNIVSNRHDFPERLPEC